MLALSERSHTAPPMPRPMPTLLRRPTTHARLAAIIPIRPVTETNERGKVWSSLVHGELGTDFSRVVARSGRKVVTGVSTGDRVRPTADKRHQEIVDGATMLIRRRITRFRLGIAEIAQLLLISPRELQRAFQAVHGSRPLQFIREQRLDRV